MAIASPTLAIAARAKFNDPRLFIAPFFFPLVPLEGSAIKPGEQVYRGKAYRVKANLNLQAPGTTQDKATEFSQLNRLFAALEDYDVDAQLYGLTVPIDKAGLGTMDRFGLANFESDVAMPLLVDALMNAREYRAASVLTNTSNYGGVVTGTSTTISGFTGFGYWTDPTVDPIQQIRAAIRSIEQKGAPLQEGQIYRMGFSQDAFDAFVTNPQVRAYYGDASAPITTSDVVNLLANTVLSGYPEEMRKSAFEIQVAKAVSTQSNIGQDAAPAYVLSDFAALVRSIPSARGTSGNGLRIPCWGKGYSGKELAIDSFEKQEEGTEGTLYYRGAHATTESVYDANYGVLFDNIVQ
jgi:hypothetical protein